MAVAPVGKLIWQMSIPPLISMFLQYSYNLIDSAFVARLSENALTAVSLSFPITTLMNATSIWIGVGVNVLIAGYLGQRKQNEANTTVTHGLLLAFGIGALLNLLSLLIMKPYFGAFTNNEEIYQLSLDYMSVCSFMQIPNMVHIAIQKMIQATGNMVNLLQSSAAASERVFEFLEEPEESQNEKNPVDINTLTGDVQFEHVKFGYNPDKIIINDFSADVKDGQKIAIVGPTGAGKTTMVKLLMRFYDLNGGSIKVDGYDIKDFNRSSLREMFGMVLQDTWLFSGTIMENIRYGRLDATDEEVIAAAKAAHVHNFIMQQPGGYDMVLDEETSNISQGQKQLLTIARAILANNKILILDEATSSVDTRTEVRIQKAMDNLMKGRTSFVIAHRLSTIKDADLILVMKDGDIIEQGNHEELLSKKGFYADLYNSQFENKATA